MVRAPKCKDERDYVEYTRTDCKHVDCAINFARSKKMGADIFGRITEQALFQRVTPATEQFAYTDIPHLVMCVRG